MTEGKTYVCKWKRTATGYEVWVACRRALVESVVERTPIYRQRQCENRPTAAEEWFMKSALVAPHEGE